MGFEETPADFQLAARGGKVDVALHMQEVVHMMSPHIIRIIHYDAHRLTLLQSLPATTHVTPPAFMSGMIDECHCRTMDAINALLEDLLRAVTIRQRVACMQQVLHPVLAEESKSWQPYVGTKRV